jgi:hypothetical protein
MPGSADVSRAACLSGVPSVFSGGRDEAATGARSWGQVACCRGVDAGSRGDREMSRKGWAATTCRKAGATTRALASGTSELAVEKVEQHDVTDLEPLGGAFHGHQETADPPDRCPGSPKGTAKSRRRIANASRRSTVPPTSAHALASQVDSDPLCSEVSTRVAPSPEFEDSQRHARAPSSAGDVRDLESAEQMREPRERDYDAQDREQEGRADVGE